MLCAIVLLLFSEVRHATFLRWDDNDYIVKNHFLQNFELENIGKMFTVYYFANWHPVTWLSHALDIQLFGHDPAGHHILNLVFHCVNAILVFILTIQFVNKYSSAENNNNSFATSNNWKIATAFITTLWFSVHPMRVESFAWVSERKDVLCTMFFLLSIIFYFQYLQHLRTRKKYYFACFVAFCFSVMSKGMAVTLPVVLLLIDFLPDMRFTENTHSWKVRLKSKELLFAILEKIPFFIVALVVGLLVIDAQKDVGAFMSSTSLSYDVRILNAINNFFVYLSKTMVPVLLLPIYPYPEHVNSINGQSILQIIFFSLIIGVAVYKAIHNNPIYLFVLLIYMVLLAPVLGILKVGNQPYADRYSYLPTIPVYIVLALLIIKFRESKLIDNNRKKTGFIAIYTVVGIFVLFAAVSAKNYLKVWKDDLTLWSHVINSSENPPATAYINLGGHFYDNGQLENAKAVLSKGIEKHPKDGILYSNLRMVYEKTKNYDEALTLIDRLKTVNGSMEVYEIDKAHFLVANGDCGKVISSMLQIIDRYPENWQIKYHLSYCYTQINDYRSALRLLEDILTRHPDNQPVLGMKKEIENLLQQSSQRKY